MTRVPESRILEVVTLLHAYPDMGFHTIADVVGLTRERVRQIALQELGTTGRERRELAKSEAEQIRQNVIVKMWEDSEFVKAARAKGLNVTPWGPRLYEVNGKRCRWSVASIREVRGGKCYYSICRPRVVCDVLVYKLTEGWFLVPWDELPKTQTMFTLKPDISRLTYTKRHNWLDYLENWKVFDNGLGGSVDSAGNSLSGESVARK